MLNVVLKEIIYKVSVDGKRVSLHALEQWTRNAGGLRRAVCQVKREIETDKAELNEAIVREVQNVSEMLEKKNAELA